MRNVPNVCNNDQFYQYDVPVKQLRLKSHSTDVTGWQSLGLGQYRIADSFKYQLAVSRLFAKQTDKQPEKVNMSIDVIGDTVNDYLTLFDESRRGTVLLISSSCLPCRHGFNVLTDCTVLGDVLCHRNALQ